LTGVGRHCARSRDVDLGGFAGSIRPRSSAASATASGTVEAVGFSTLVAGTTGILVLLVARPQLAGVRPRLPTSRSGCGSAASSARSSCSRSPSQAPKIGVCRHDRARDHRQPDRRRADRPLRLVRREQIPLEWTRVVGIQLLAGGDALLRKYR
jgi:hypothetical protein